MLRTRVISYQKDRRIYRHLLPFVSWRTRFALGRLITQAATRAPKVVLDAKRWAENAIIGRWLLEEDFRVSSDSVVELGHAWFHGFGRSRERSEIDRDPVLTTGPR